jgi:hypothetical protein
VRPLRPHLRCEKRGGRDYKKDEYQATKHDDPPTSLTSDPHYKTCFTNIIETPFMSSWLPDGRIHEPFDCIQDRLRLITVSGVTAFGQHEDWLDRSNFSSTPSRATLHSTGKIS